MTTDSLDLNIVHRWDDSSLQLLYRHFYKALVAFAIQAVETQESAEEIVQDIFVKTWQKHNTFKSTATLKAYLYNGVRNECISHLRRQQTAQERIRQFEKDYHQLQMGTGRKPSVSCCWLSTAFHRSCANCSCWPSGGRAAKT